MLSLTYIGPLLKSKNYILIGLNLENISQLTSLLVECGLSLNKSTAILTEGVLPYLEERRCIYVYST